MTPVTLCGGWRAFALSPAGRRCGGGRRCCRGIPTRECRRGRCGPSPQASRQGRPPRGGGTTSRWPVGLRDYSAQAACLEALPVTHGGAQQRVGDAGHFGEAVAVPHGGQLWKWVVAAGWPPPWNAAAAISAMMARVRSSGHQRATMWVAIGGFRSGRPSEPPRRRETLPVGGERGGSLGPWVGSPRR